MDKTRIEHFVRKESPHLPCIFCGASDVSVAGFFVPLTAMPVDGMISPNRMYGYSVCDKCDGKISPDDRMKISERQIVTGQGEYVYLGRLVKTCKYGEDPVEPFPLSSISSYEMLKEYDKTILEQLEGGYYIRPFTPNDFAPRVHRK